jgi:hypothetical protein
MPNSKRIWFVVPAWLCQAADVSLTLAGQSGEYWSGDYTAATEANPFAHPILVAGPWVFAFTAIAWAILLGVLIAFLSNRFLAWFVIALAVAHAIGASTWLAGLGGWVGWVLAGLFLFVASEASWWCWRRSGWFDDKTNAKPDGIEADPCT